MIFLFIRLLPLVLLLTTVAAICDDPLQPIDQCTSCSTLDFLVGRTCYPRIRGCLTHAPGPVCLQCQLGYNLVGSTCVRNGNILQNSHGQLRGESEQDGILRQSVRKLENQNQVLLANSHELFLSKHPNQLGNQLLQIKSLDFLQAKEGNFTIITYTLPDQKGVSKQYQAVSIAKTDKTLKEVYFGELKGKGRDPVTTSKRIDSLFKSFIFAYHLFDFRQNNDTIQFDYISEFSDFLRISIQVADLGLDDKELFKKFSINILTAQDVGLEKVKERHGDLGKVKDVVKVGNIWVANFGPTLSISFWLVQSRFIINSPLFLPVDEYVGPDGLRVSKQKFTNLPKKDFKAAELVFWVLKRYPELKFSEIVKTNWQYIADFDVTAYIIVLEQKFPKETIEIIGTVNAKSDYLLLRLQRNGETIFEDYYNYNADHQFLKDYSTNRFFWTRPPITNVSMTREREDKKVLKINYSPLEYVEHVTVPSGSFVSTYYIDGWNYLDTPNDTRLYRKKLQPETLLLIIKQSVSGTEQAQIESVDYKIPLYYPRFVTNNGTFVGTVETVGDVNYFRGIEKVSNTTCFQLNLSDPRTRPRVSSLQYFLKQAYNGFVNYTIGLVQVQIKQNSILYRAVFQNPNLQQFEAKFENIEEVLWILSVRFIDYSFRIVRETSDLRLYNEALRALEQVEIGNKNVLMVDANQTMIRIYYVKDLLTLLVVYDRTTGKIVENYPINDAEIRDCKERSSTGKCISCDKVSQSEYKGSCYAKIEGCRFQLGNFCARCDVGYTRVNPQECNKNCSLYF